MKSGIILIIIGICMFSTGLILFYFIDVTEDNILKNISFLG